VRAFELVDVFREQAHVLDEKRDLVADINHPHFQKHHERREAYLVNRAHQRNTKWGTVLRTTRWVL
jgi:hypothetical protein